MGIFRRSMDLTKTSWKVIKKDKELLIYPILTLIISIIYIVGLLFAMGFFLIAAGGEIAASNIAWNTFQIVLAFVLYFGIAIIMTFFNVCICYTAKTRFEGGNAHMSEAFKFAFGRFGKIILWAILSATVGVIMFLIRLAASESDSIVSKILLYILYFGMSMAWTILSLFAVPAIVFYDLSPFEAMKDSANKFKSTWGENLVRSFGFALAQFLAYIGAIIITVALWYISMALNSITMLIITIIVGVTLFLMIYLIFSVMDKVYTTALYIYADTGKLPGVYDKELIVAGFKTSSKKTRNRY